MNKTKRSIAIFTLVEHKCKEGKYFGYAPYINEMNMWISHFDKVNVLAPYSSSTEIDRIELSYDHSNIDLIKIPAFNIKSFSSILKLAALFPLIVYKMAKVMRRTDHLHFRCPSNVSAIAAVVQIFFPSKPKSTKYAGNWDPNSEQPLGYRFQKWLLANRTLTKNMKVLVYGKWEGQSRSVVPFISATYFESEKLPFKKRDYSKTLKFVFIGAMVVGKRPMLTVKVIEHLIRHNVRAELHMFGDGPLIDEVKNYIGKERLGVSFFVYGNQPKEKVKDCLMNAHFTILPSKSEGWPKAIAEGMFFGAIPISTKISCLPWILDYGKRGILIEPEVISAANMILKSLKMGEDYLNSLSKNAQQWSTQYTVDRLENEIRAIVNRK